MIRAFPEHTGREGGFRETGLLVLHPPEDEPAVRGVVARLNQQGIRTELLAPAEIARRWPAFDLAGIGLGAYELDAGYADPVLVTAGLLERARELGARTRLGRRVERIEPRGPAWSLLLDDGERLSCARVLIAAGPRGAERVPAFGDLPNGYYLRPEGEELFLVGPLHPGPRVDPDDFPEALTEAEAARPRRTRRAPRPRPRARAGPRGVGEPVRREPRLAARDRRGRPGGVRRRRHERPRVQARAGARPARRGPRPGGSRGSPPRAVPPPPLRRAPGLAAGYGEARILG